MLFIPHTFFQCQMEQNDFFPISVRFLSRNATLFALEACTTLILGAKCKKWWNFQRFQNNKSEKHESVSKFRKKPFLLGNLSFLIHFRYTFLGFFAIPSTDSTKRYHFCFKCMHNFDCARNAKKTGHRFRSKSMQLPRLFFCEFFENRFSSRRGIPMRKWEN